MNTRTRVKAIPVLLAASLGLGTFGKAMAHEGHVQANLQPTGFAEIALTVTEEGVTGMPETVAAGRYLVKVTGPEMDPEMGPSGVSFAQLPEGLTVEQAFEEIQAATDGPPAWFLDAFWGGGAPIIQGTEAWVIVDLTPGNWAVSTMGGTTLPVAFESTGEFPADVAEPEADVELEMFEMDFRVAKGEFVAGDNIVTIRNTGAQIHFTDAMMVPEGTTQEQVDMLFNSFMTGTPEAGMLDESAMIPAAYVPEQSPGVQQTLVISLEAGTYLFTCWVPDPETGAPHAMLGMHELIIVA